MPRRDELLPITGVRFFLALWVVIFHHAAPGGYLGERLPWFPTAIASLFRSGHLAVGAFFVLSGFVLSYNYSLADRWTSPRLVRFAVARFARIYPVYCIGLLLAAPFRALAIPNDLSFAILVKELAVGLLNWTLLQAWIPRIALSWNLPGWSLSCEAFFYCCFPFIGVAIWRLSGWRELAICGCLICLAAQIAPLFAVWLPLSGFAEATASLPLDSTGRFWVHLLTFNPLLRLPDFCLGIVLGKVYHELRGGSGRWLGRGFWLYTPGICLELLAATYRDSVPLPLRNGLFLPLHSLVILGLALGGGPLARYLSSRPVVFLGGASYAMYILHVPVMLWMNAVAKEAFSVTIDGLGVMAVYLLIVVGLSAFVFEVIEQPANRWVKKKLISMFEASRWSEAAVFPHTLSSS